MPFIRVSYVEQQYDTLQLKQISQTILEALNRHFQVPEEDFFQVFHAHKREEFMYSNNYLGVGRSDGLLFIQVTCKSGRTTEQKTNFYETLAATLSKTLPMRKEDVFVVLSENEFVDWSFGDGMAQMLQGTAGEAPNRGHRKIESHAKEAYGSYAPAFASYSEDVLFGDVWRREQLSLRDRSMITVAALVAGGMTGQLPFHLKLAQENGVRPEELVEAITHLAFYTGWPRAASALSAAKSIFGADTESQ